MSAPSNVLFDYSLKKDENRRLGVQTRDCPPEEFIQYLKEKYNALLIDFNCYGIDTLIKRQIGISIIMPIDHPIYYVIKHTVLMQNTREGSEFIS